MLEVIRRHLSEELIFSEIFYKEIVRDLPPMLAVTDAWVDDRPTIKSVYEAGSNLFVLKSHFLKVYRRYVVGAEEEAIELCRARSRENKIDELGDVTFYLLHFFRAAGLDINQLSDFSFDRESLGNERVARLLSSLHKAIGRKLVLQAIREMRKSLRESHYLLFGGSMSFGNKKTDAPWLNDRDSQQWLALKKEISYYWMIAFGSVMRLASQMELDMLDLINQTSTKASRNFPKEFFNPAFSWFSLNLNGDEKDVACCRLFRKTYKRPGVSYLDLFYKEQDKKSFTPESFKFFVKMCLKELALLPSTRTEAERLLWRIDFVPSKG